VQVKLSVSFFELNQLGIEPEYASVTLDPVSHVEFDDTANDSSILMISGTLKA